MNKAEFRQHQDDWRQALISHRKESGRSLEGTTIRVALALQHYEHAAEGEDQCCAFPTRLSLAVRLGLEGKPEHQRRTITKHLTALEKAGFIVKIREGVRPSYEYPKGQSAKWRLTTPVEDKKRLDSMWDELASPDGVGGQTEQEVGGQTEHVGAQDEGVGGQTEQVTRSVYPQKPVQFAHPTTPDYQPLTNQPLTVGVDFSEKRESENQEPENLEQLQEFCDAYPGSASPVMLGSSYGNAIEAGATHGQLVAAANEYAAKCERLATKPMFVLSFLKNDTWAKYVKEDRPS